MAKSRDSPIEIIITELYTSAYLCVCYKSKTEEGYVIRKLTSEGPEERMVRF